jgi:peroxiredoxin
MKIFLSGFFCLLLLFFTCILYGQENTGNKPERVIVANDEIITMAQLEQYAKTGYIKAMNNGVSDEVRGRLFKKFGDKIGPKEFIMQIALYTEEEMKNKEKIGIPMKSPSQKDSDFYVLNINDSIKDFSVLMMTGEHIQLSHLKGNVVLINFWATWCAPCIREFYEFPSKIISPFKNTNFVLLPVAVGESMEKVKNKMTQLNKEGINFNVGIDLDTSIFNTYTSGNIPQNFLIDKKGIIRYVSTGYTEENINKIFSMIQQLLEE